MYLDIRFLSACACAKQNFPLLRDLPRSLCFPDARDCDDLASERSVISRKVPVMSEDVDKSTGRRKLKSISSRMNSLPNAECSRCRHVALESELHGG